MLDFYRYANTVPFSTGTLEAYRAEESRLNTLFMVEALADVGLAEHPKRDVIFAWAYRSGHSGGYHEVYCKLMDLADFVRQLES
jgi:hypothetical protein